ncbi:hypothetical protein Q5752_002412 [Cryptotrichosporon argae]
MASTLRQRAASPAGEAEKKALIREAEQDELTEGQKFIVPDYTVKQLLDAIPAHCYKRSALHSSLYVLQDFALLGALVYGAFHIESFLSRFNLGTYAYYAARAALWTAYSVSAGLVGTGVWIIGHEAGHQAFSSSKTINNTVGWFLHSLVLVPYHSWRISHGRHHAATGHMTRDEVFVPRTRQERGYPEVKHDSEVQGLSVPAWRQAELAEALGESPIVSLFNLVLQQVFGWPMYLFRNASGQLHYPAYTNHFQPSSVIFRPSHYWQILVSDLGVIMALAALGTWGYFRGFREVLVVYIIPYLWVNNWLVMITFLQHTDPVLPHYSDKSWTFARGALATIDRKFMGPIGPYILHGICETHVSHHVSSKIPHYNAWEATEALKNFLGPHYHCTDTNFLATAFRNYHECRFVEDNQDIVFFKNARGVAQKVGVEDAGNISDSGIDMSPVDKEGKAE